MTPEPNARVSNASFKGMAATAVGAAAGVYSGSNVLIPAVVGGVVWAIGRKVAPPHDPSFLAAISVQAGHLVWLAAGMAITGQWGANIIDLAVLSVGLVWLWVRPGLVPVSILTVFQALALAINLFAISEPPFGSALHKALAVHIVLRVAALFLMWQAYLASRKVHGS